MTIEGNFNPGPISINIAKWQWDKKEQHIGVKNYTMIIRKIKEKDIPVACEQ